MSIRQGSTIIAGSSGSGGTSNYNNLENKPSINGITLEGNKTTEDLNINSLPDQTGNEGKVLITNGTEASWQTLPETGLPLFAHIWSDHLLTNSSYLRADTFSWQDGNIYYTAYNELVNEKNLTTETSTNTINDITITYYRTPKGYKIVLPDMADNLVQLYENTGTAWYYILDVDNVRFKLPRNSRYESGTTTELAGDFSAESLPNITGAAGNILSTNPSGVFLNSQEVGTASIPTGEHKQRKLTFDASLSSSTYQGGAKVNPDHVTQFLYFYVGNTIQNETTINIAEITEALNNKADRDLNNLTEDATNAVKPSDITNCITKIPQDIKLELNDGTLTLKAGSKVYVPNGPGVFDEVVISSDLSTSGFHDGQIMILAQCSSLSSTSINAITEVLVSNAKSGTSPEVGVYYNTSLNIIYRYTSSSVYDYRFALPIAICTRTSGKISSIDQVFNGFGYIGSTVFALPGVEGLIPNGRNEDGSLNNILIKTSQLYTRDFSIQPSLSANLCIATIGIGFNPNLKYNENKNLLIDITTNTINNDRFEAGYLSVDEEGRPITFTIKNTFQAVDRNDTEWASTQSKPSDRYVDLTLQASGTTYTAPANGWFVFDKQAAAQGQYIQFNESNKCTLTAYAYNNDSRLSLLYPILKNKKISVVYNASGVTNYFRFIYDEGAK